MTWLSPSLARSLNLIVWSNAITIGRPHPGGSQAAATLQGRSSVLAPAVPPRIWLESLDQDIREAAQLHRQRRSMRIEQMDRQLARPPARQKRRQPSFPYIRSIFRSEEQETASSPFPRQTP